MVKRIFFNPLKHFQLITTFQSFFFTAGKIEKKGFDKFLRWIFLPKLGAKRQILWIRFLLYTDDLLALKALKG